MRLELTRKTDLAVRALWVLDDGARRKGSELAELVGSSAPFIAQVMAPLVRAGWVASDPGPTGGYIRAVDAGQISMLELIEALEGPVDTGACVLREGPCPGETLCALHEAWIEARAALTDVLDRTTVAGAKRRLEVK